MFVKKKKVPCCRRRIGLPSGETSGLHVNRVTCINYRTYAVVDPIGDSASGRAEETIFVHKKFALCANFL